MYTKNPVSGKNETLVNTSMLKGAVDGVTSKIASKADKGALVELSLYAENVAASVAGKANKSEVQSLSEYVEGRLPKTVYDTMVDAYVGLACKVADPDVLEGAAKMAFAADPVKYATSNPDDDRCAKVMWYDYGLGNPIFDAVHAAGTAIELSPLLRLQFTNGEIYNTQYGTGEFPLVWKTELPNLATGERMFYNIGLTSWDVELPNLTNGSQMFNNTGLTQFNAALPNLTEGDEMFSGCNLDVASIRHIAETIRDVNGHTSRLVISIGTSAPQPSYQEWVDLLNEKGWYVEIR